MSSRARSARQLAEQLSARTGIPVRISWHQPNWLVWWTDGPRVAAMRAHTIDAPPRLRSALRLSRELSPAALAAGLLGMARAGQLPATPRVAVLSLATWFDELDADDWADLLPTAQALAERCGGDQRRMAAAVLASHQPDEHNPPAPLSAGRDPGREPTARYETPPAPRPSPPPRPDRPHASAQPAQTAAAAGDQRQAGAARYQTPPAPALTTPPPRRHTPREPQARDETPPAPDRRARCGHCDTTLPAPAGTGRPRRWCSSACRQAAHRRRVTKPRYQTPSVAPALFPTPTREENR